MRIDQVGNEYGQDDPKVYEKAKQEQELDAMVHKQ
jgi:hypothetical protein